jgi:heme-degrading monooxygenase HmoA
MIRVIYRWKIKPGHETGFIAAWDRMTRAIRDAVPGARGSLLLRPSPLEMIAIARWESVEAWKALKSLQLEPEAWKIMSDAIDTTPGPAAPEVCEELVELTRLDP